MEEKEEEEENVYGVTTVLSLSQNKALLSLPWLEEWTLTASLSPPPPPPPPGLTVCTGAGVFPAHPMPEPLPLPPPPPDTASYRWQQFCGSASKRAISEHPTCHCSSSVEEPCVSLVWKWLSL